LLSAEGVILPSTKNILHNLSSEIGKILNESMPLANHSINGVSLFLIEMNECEALYHLLMMIYNLDYNDSINLYIKNIHQNLQDCVQK
jgi:hypothetical protein